ncbi:hypothetical protein J3R82DRAFT_9105 [Butyriboletus roseoflavus]|nr:hypothetical protein J3R82DRAFT_9105 [Butyriboletus roseoflavus]
MPLALSSPAVHTLLNYVGSPLLSDLANPLALSDIATPLFTNPATPTSSLAAPPSENLAISQGLAPPLMPHHDIISSMNGTTLMTNIPNLTTDPFANPTSDSFTSLLNGFVFPGLMLDNSWNNLFVSEMDVIIMNPLWPGMDIDLESSPLNANHNRSATSSFQQSTVNPSPGNAFPDFNAFQYVNPTYGFNVEIQNLYNFSSILNVSGMFHYITVPALGPNSQLVPPTQVTTSPVHPPLVPSPNGQPVPSAQVTTYPVHPLLIPSPSLPPAGPSPPLQSPTASLQQPLFDVAIQPAPVLSLT